MSSYHSNFDYLNKNSKDDFNLLITHFDADSGETESYLIQEQVYTPSHNGAKRMLYGTKWTSVATIKITVIKQNRSDFSVSDCRQIYRWLTGNPAANWLDLYANGKLQYSFLCTVQDVKPQKLDARTIGLNIYFESLHPWAYSPVQKAGTSFGQALTMENGILMKTEESLTTNNAGILNNGTNATFDVTEDGVIYIDNSTMLLFDESMGISDELYSNINLSVKFTNINSDHLIIKNETLYEATNGADGLTEIVNMADGEVIELTPEQLIISDVPGKVFGDSFNFVWPKLMPGANKITVSGTGSGKIELTYRYPIKIGDCAIDVYTSGGEDCNCSDNTTYGVVSWDDIADTPTTLGGYGITDAYTITEVDTKIENIEISGGGGGTIGDLKIDEAELNQMLDDVLGD